MYSSDNANTSLLIFFLTTLINSDDSECNDDIYDLMNMTS